jgi:glutamine amidotransferase
VQIIALIDYGAGNLRSVERALLAASAKANRRREVRVTNNPDVVRLAHRIVLPGQGAFAACMAGLQAQPGMVEALNESVLQKGKPFLGVCVGMQLLMQEGLEHTTTPGLGWIAGQCRQLETSERLPHMGWNAVRPLRPHPVLSTSGAAAHFYFAHSYAVYVDDPATALAETDHGAGFVSAVAKDNIVGVQFHPEKSQDAGLALLARFVDWTPH